MAAAIDHAMIKNSQSTKIATTNYEETRGNANCAMLSLNGIYIYCKDTTRMQYTIDTLTDTGMKGKTLLHEIASPNANPPLLSQLPRSPRNLSLHPTLPTNTTDAIRIESYEGKDVSKFKTSRFPPKL